LLRGGAVVAAGLAIELGSQFARTIILARLLGATGFGIVVSINTLIALVEMMCFIGIDRYIIYAPEGSERIALDVGHALSVLRGIFSAAVVLALAAPTAALIGEQSHTASFAVVAVVPLLRGPMHLGVVQMQRHGRFWPAAAADAGGAILGLLTATVAALIVRDHRAILWALGAQTGGALLLTHVFARACPYRVSFDWPRIRTTLMFGLPLLANGVALAASFQLDRMVVGAWLGVVALGIYGLSTTLLLQPIALVVRLATTTLQPRLSAFWHADPEGGFTRLARHLSYYGAVLSAAAAATTACLGAPVVKLLFGHSYAAADGFFVLMAGVVLIRLGRGALNLLGLAIGRTSDLMISNIVGVAALPAMMGAFYLYPNMEAAAFGALVGEFLGAFAAHVRLRVNCGSAIRKIAQDFAFAAIAPTGLGIWVVVANPPLLQRAIAAATIIAGVGLLMLRELKVSHAASEHI
jgi:O-antigen/teichoic acid export membrane protein